MAGYSAGPDLTAAHLLRQRIERALRAAPRLSLKEAAEGLLDVLGYRSERRPLEQSGRVDDFIDRFPALNKDTRTENEFRKNATAVHVLFQFTSDEIPADLAQGALFEVDGFDTDNTRSYMFAAVDLTKSTYPRGPYARFTREVNKRLRVPTVVLFRTAGERLTFAFVHRRTHMRDKTRDVLGSVSLIREIDPCDLHRAHVDILADLALENRLEWTTAYGKPRDFDGLLAAWLAALDTQELNKTFYRELFEWFNQAVESANFPQGQPITLHAEEHVIRLITRLLFVWFVKEKGLVANKLFVEEQVGRLLKDYDRASGDSYYRAVLQNLFFATLNTEIARRGFSRRTNATHRDFSRFRYRNEMQNPDELLALFNQTPFINGGLFDCLDSEESTRDGGSRIDCFSDNPRHRDLLSIPNRLFFGEHGLIDLLDGYKFTVEENTPAEQEVALDPELLGRVFENLLAAYNPETRETARRQTGSYYTPRPVVDYMVEEALVEALAERTTPADGDPAFWRERLRYLLDYHDAGELFEDDETDGLVRAIAQLKVLDPAVGSGAFPMGVLHKLVLALRRLDPRNELWEALQRENALEKADHAFEASSQRERDEELQEISDTFERYRADFGRKLYLIQNSVYGVDIQSPACQIAKLRFFISLAIEQEPTNDPSDNYGIKPLPNLETRFVTANTLRSLDRSGQRTLAQTDDVTRLEYQLAANRERYFHATNRRDKRDSRSENKQLRLALADALQAAKFNAADAKRIAQWDNYDQNAKANWFDAGYMFGITQGFDVVLGNPPYVKVEHLNQDTRDQLRSDFGWAGDLYEHFIFQGLDFVKTNGVFTYIANDSYVTFSSKRRVRDLMLKNQLLGLVRSPAQTFEASIYAAIFVLLKKPPSDSHAYMSGRMNLPGFDIEKFGDIDYKLVYEIPDRKFLLQSDTALLTRLLSLQRASSICSILDTGIHSGNVRSKLFFIQGGKGRDRMLQGRQIHRYCLYWNSPQARYKFCNTRYEPLPIPGVGRGGKPSPRNEYWHFCGDINNHHQPERLLMRQTDDDLVVAFHSENESGRFYTDNTLFTILPKDSDVPLKYLLALFNSKLLNFVYQSISQEQGKSQAQVKVKNVRDLPIVTPDSRVRESIIEVVDRILSTKTVNPEADTGDLESDIDRLVYEIYGLSESEIETVEASQKKL